MSTPGRAYRRDLPGHQDSAEIARRKRLKARRDAEQAKRDELAAKSAKAPVGKDEEE